MKVEETKMRKPKIKNKHNLTISKIKKMKIGDRSKIKEPLFWRNNIIQAWCISGSTARNSKEDECGIYNEYWLGIYDKDAKAYADKFRIYFSTYGGMCGYIFNKFFEQKDIECEVDLLVQEIFLEKINYLIDEGVLIISH